MRIENFYPGSFGSNCYLLSAGTHAAIVDPSADADTLLDALAQRALTPTLLLLTHGHFDHMLSLDTLSARTGLEARIGEGDLSYPADARKNAFFFFTRMERTWHTPAHVLRDGDELKLGDESIRVLHTPGHTPGSVMLLCNGEFLLTGDTLFADNYGRYDLPGGDRATLFETLSSLRRLDGSLPIYPGHGAPSTLGEALDKIGIP